MDDESNDIDKIVYGENPERNIDYQGRPLHLDPVFEHAREKQFEVRGLRSDASDESILKLAGIVDAIAAELTKEAHENGLTGQSVQLSGENIEYALGRHVLRENAYLVTPDDQVESNIPVESDNSGLFAGFVARYEAIFDSDGEFAGLRPYISYQIKVGNIDSPHLYGSICITGDVGITQIEFERDIHSRRIAEAITKLLEYPSEIVAKYVHEIHSELMGSGNPEGSKLKRIGYLSEKIINALDPELE